MVVSNKFLYIQIGEKYRKTSLIFISEAFLAWTLKKTEGAPDNIGTYNQIRGFSKYDVPQWGRKDQYSVAAETIRYLRYPS